MANPQDIPSAVTELQEFNKESTALVVTLQDLAQALRENAGAAAKFTGESAGAYKSMFSESITMASKMEGYTVNQLKNRKSEAQFLKDLSKLEQDRARAQSKISFLEEKLVTARKSEIPFIEKSLAILKNVDDTLEQQLEHANKLKNTFEEISKEVKVFDDLSDFFNEIPGVSKVFGEFQKAADSARAAAAEGGNSFAAGAKQLGGALTKGLAAFAITTVVKGLTSADERAVSLSRNLNKSADESFRLVKGFNAAARGIQGLTGAEIEKGATVLADSLGSTAVSSNSTAYELAGIVKTMGMSTEEAAKQAEFSQATGQDIAKAGNEMRGQVMLSNLRNKTSIKYQSIMKDVANTSSATKLLMQGQGVSITKAAIEAKKLGTTLEGISKIGASMLDFESSIANELEAELLTGGEINNERARALALKGDELGLAEEIKKSGVLTKFANADNVLQQEALAKAYGMSKDEMADMVVKSRALKEMGASDSKDLQKKYRVELDKVEALKKQADLTKSKLDQEKYLTAEKNLQQKVGGEELRRQLDTQTVQDKQAEAMAKMGEAMDKLLPILQKIGDVFEFIGRHAESIGKALLVIAGGAMLAKLGKLVAMLARLGKAPGAVGNNVANLTKTATSAGGTAVAKGSAAAGAGAAGAGAKGMAGMAKQVASMKAANPGMTSAQALGSIKAGAPAAQAAAKGGGMFSNLLKGGKALIGSISPGAAVKNALKSVGGFKGILGKALKGSILNTLLTGFFAYSDIKDLIQNPVDEDGKKLNQKQVDQKVGKITAGGLGGIIGGILGAAVGPLGSIAGSLGGQWLMENIMENSPDAAESLGSMITPLSIFKDKEKKVQKLANGGVATAAQLAILGEAGKEAVVPLDEFYRKIDQVVLAVNRLGSPLAGMYTKMDQLTTIASKPSISLTGIYTKMDQLIAATSNKPITKETKPETVNPLTGLYAKMDQLIAVTNKPVTPISLAGIYAKMDQLIAATSSKPITKEVKQETADPLTGLYAKLDQLIAATNKPVANQVVPEITIPLTGLYAKIDQLIAAATKPITKEAAPEAILPLAGLYAKIDQLIAATGKTEITVPLTSLYAKLDQLIAVSSTPATTISLTGLYEKIDQLIAATNNKPVVNETKTEIAIPLTGIYAKLDQLIAAAKESVTVTGLDKISSMISSLGEQRSIKKIADKTPETVEALRSVITPLSAWKDKNKEETKTAPAEEKQIIKPVQTLAAGVGNDTATSLTALYAKMDQLILATKENTAATKETTAAVQKIDINPNLYLGTNKLNETIGLNIHRI